jgi:ribosomal protein S18 acetylase RimI-like enzyme
MWRVSLRAPAAGDASAVDRWLQEALGAVGGRISQAPPASLDQVVRSLSEAQRMRLIALRSGEPIGLIVTSPLGGARTAIDVVAIAAGSRNIGLGSEAILVLEEAEPATKLLPGVPVENGLAIYFWLRIGYAPIFPRDAGSELGIDRIWMARRGCLSRASAGAGADCRPGQRT